MKSKDNKIIKEYYTAIPRFYTKDNEIICVCTLTENVLTALPKSLDYETEDGRQIEDYRLTLVSITENKVIAELEYNKAITKLMELAEATSKNNILVELNYKEMKELIEALS